MTRSLLGAIPSRDAQGRCDLFSRVLHPFGARARRSGAALRFPRRVAGLLLLRGRRRKDDGVDEDAFTFLGGVEAGLDGGVYRIHGYPAAGTTSFRRVSSSEWQFAGAGVAQFARRDLGKSVRRGFAFPVVPDGDGAGQPDDVGLWPVIYVHDPAALVVPDCAVIRVPPRLGEEVGSRRADLDVRFKRIETQVPPRPVSF